MKPRLTTLLGLLAIGLVLQKPVEAQPAPAVSVTVSDARGFPGRTIPVPVALSQTGAASAAQFDLRYDESQLIGGGFQPPVTPANTVVRLRQITPGRQRVLAYTTDRSALRTNIALGRLLVALPSGEAVGGGEVTISDAAFATANASQVSPFHLNPGTVQVSPIFRGEDGVVDFYATAQAGKTYLIQASADLISWVNIATNTPLQNYIVTTDPDAQGFPSRFYRAVPEGSGSGQRLASEQPTAAGDLALRYPTTPGRTYVLQASTNLTGWDALVTNVAAAPVLGFKVEGAGLTPWRYFRVVELP